jgi:hypothetical protein
VPRERFAIIAIDEYRSDSLPRGCRFVARGDELEELIAPLKAKAGVGPRVRADGGDDGDS